MTAKTEVGVGPSETTVKKDKEVLVVQDQGLFTFETADTYDGCFEAKKKDRIAKMHGVGVYTTAEGDIYTGTWDNDKLGANLDVRIQYSDGSRYEGLFKEWCYNNRGKYIYPDSSLLECEFLENCPVGKLKLIDPNGHVWLGKAEQGYGWLSPVNHYFDMLEKSRDSSRTKKSKKPEQDTVKSRRVSLSPTKPSSPTKTSSSPTKPKKK
ncbi:unnamed protein product [Arctia plantaginis]|nr:unnamed protein product [Arctia plantaginis]